MYFDCSTGASPGAASPGAGHPHFPGSSCASRSYNKCCAIYYQHVDPHRDEWLDRNNPAELAFGSAWGMNLADDNAKPAQYYTMPASLHSELEHATVELHSMFVEGTRVVLKDPSLWKTFGFPASFWCVSMLYRPFSMPH